MQIYFRLVISSAFEEVSCYRGEKLKTQEIRKLANSGMAGCYKVSSLLGVAQAYS